MDSHDTNAEPVSIIITVYNRGDLLPQTIDSALRQTYPNTEVIIVDDGSIDDTPNICARYRDKIRYFRKENGGHASALNRGISEMRGTWFKWLDSDDILEDNAIEELVKFAKEKNARFVYSDYSIIDIHGNKTGEIIGPEYPTSLNFATKLWNNAFNCIINANTILVHKNVFEEVGLIDPYVKYPNEIDFFLRACIIHNIKFHRCPKLLVRYRIHKRQFSSVTGIESVKEVVKVRNTIRRLYIEKNGQEAWNELMRKFEKHSEGIVWKPVIAKLVTRLPLSMGTFAFRLYKNLMGRTSIFHRYEDL